MLLDCVLDRQAFDRVGYPPSEPVSAGVVSWEQDV